MRRFQNAGEINQKAPWSDTRRPAHRDTTGEYCNAEDLADALKMAADAADVHADNIHTKAQLANFAYKAWLIEHTEEAEKTKKTEELLTELISYGVMKGVIRNDE